MSQSGHLFNPQEPVQGLSRSAAGDITLIGNVVLEANAVIYTAL